MYDYSFYKSVIKEVLKPERYTHSIGVFETAKKLAEKWGADSEDAALAGLLHDITKNMPDDEQIKMIKQYDIEQTEALMNCPFVWHAFTSAEYIKNVLKIENEDIISAVRYHTTGKKNMTLLEKIIYVADLVEPGRTYTDAKKLYDTAFENLDEVVFEGSKWCIYKNSRDGGYIYPDTLDLYNECVLKRK